jgi:hypothetical protein
MVAQRTGIPMQKLSEDDSSLLMGINIHSIFTEQSLNIH